jgi:hypothetical protein
MRLPPALSSDLVSDLRARAKPLAFDTALNVTSAIVDHFLQADFWPGTTSETGVYIA